MKPRFGQELRNELKGRANSTFEKGKIQTRLINQNTGKLEKVALIPIGKTILRQVAF